MHRRRLRWVPVALAAAAGLPAMAQSSRHEASIGVLQVMPDTSSTTLAVVSPVASELAGSGFSVRGYTTLGASYAYRHDDRVAVEVRLAVPRRAEFPGTGTLAGIGVLGSARVIAPVVLLRWTFGAAGDALRFSVAGGVNYTRLPQVRLTDTFSQALSMQLSNGQSAAFRSEARFSSSWNLAAGVGASLRLAPAWRLDARLTYLPLKSTATIRTDAAGTEVVSQGTLKIRPLLLFVGTTREF